MEYKIRKSMRVIILVMCFCLVTICNSSAYEDEINKLSVTMAEKIASAKKTKVAVVDFTDLQGDVTELGRFIAEEFSVALVSTGKRFKVVDRTHLKSIIKEHKLSATGAINPDTARKLGKIAGVEALVTGTLTPFGDSVRISVKILDTTTAEVIDAKRGDIAKTQAIEELLGRIATSGTGLTNIGATKPIQKPKTYQKTVVKEFTFELQLCKKTGKSLNCYFLISSNNQDKKLYVDGTDGSRIFDDIGNEYLATAVQFGNKTDNSEVGKMLPANVPTKARIDFENISPQASRIAILEVSTDKFKVQFRNVAFSK
ncbi:MAG: hypothetical protein GY749_34875 [Desulfobacteraceae bacterium]|nr:hypothetical protein [Desulfobacteraceae bacterium]